MIAFVSGHIIITEPEFLEHYRDKITAAFEAGNQFVIGDAPGVDMYAQRMVAQLCQQHNKPLGETLTVFHMYQSPRCYVQGAALRGDFRGDEHRDSAMTAASDFDIAWVRPGRKYSGTQYNLNRRAKQ